ncbi:MAG: glutamine-hydrolyzing GMP synthase [Candidatus Eiseniibacteriota bacterium]|nr:MAG: glutamine-hydrolyzing GMP synthase [Candidatus Eisenbacteria bacterium]
MKKPRRENILILDFGSQYTQLIARRIREHRVFSEIVRHDIRPREIRRKAPRGLVLSGGPWSVYQPNAPMPHPGVFEMGLPVLGICYGMQVMSHVLGGKVGAGKQGEYGRSTFRRIEKDPLLAGLPRSLSVWMSHRDVVDAVPSHFVPSGEASGSRLAAAHDDARKLHMLLFHPEVVHTDFGKRIFKNFLSRICACEGTWSLEEFVQDTCRRIRREVGSGRAIAALSGGVDSSVACVLAHRALGSRLTCIYVDHGLGRADDAEGATRTLEEKFGLRVKRVDAGRRFLKKLEGVEDPEKKRRIIGEEFIRTFEEESEKLKDTQFLVQGTLYPDVIESVSWKGPSASIKTHHNVGGLPSSMNLRIVEPLKELFKDEVRQVGRLLKVPQRVLMRHPFPGPGLAVRILGAVTSERLERVREADRIFLEELRAAGLYDEVWQALAVLLPVKSVGVMGDSRTYEDVVALRAVTSRDGMTADWARIPARVLSTVSNRIVNEVKGVNRVVYDVSSKPPATIEWE